jgi:hypothetical protein
MSVLPGSSPYAGRRICLTTLHGKEQALARPFALGLGANLVVSTCDTDRLGTFSGERERPADALETCRRKALLGLERTGLTIGLASEGSFGPHPAAPLLPVGMELLLFLDRERDLTVVERRLELRTNFAQLRLVADADPTTWLRQVGFPAHAVIARPAGQAAAGTARAGTAAAVGALLFKGLTTAAQLSEALQRCRATDPEATVLLETDMRAHLNPTRMRSIRRLGCALVRRLGSPCPRCASPGWGLVETRPGLPCRWCGTPTQLTAVEVKGCVRCGYQAAHGRRDGLAAADPGHCDRCNP